MIDIVLPAFLLLIAAASDMIRRIIPDWTSVGLALCGAVGMVRAGDPWAAGAALAAAVAVFVTGAGLFALGWMGGGDVKLASAAILVTGAQGALILLFGMSLIGLAMGVAALLGGVALGVARGRAPSAALAEARAIRLPYGVAISGGALLALAQGA